MKRTHRITWLALVLLAAAVPCSLSLQFSESNLPGLRHRKRFPRLRQLGFYIYQYPSKFQLVFWLITWRRHGL